MLYKCARWTMFSFFPSFLPFFLFFSLFPLPPFLPLLPPLWRTSVPQLRRSDLHNGQEEFWNISLYKTVSVQQLGCLVWIALLRLCHSISIRLRSATPEGVFSSVEAILLMIYFSAWGRCPIESPIFYWAPIGGQMALKWNSCQNGSVRGKFYVSMKITRVSTHEQEHWDNCLCTHSLLKRKFFNNSPLQ